jgi:hypothetical protein
MYHIKYTTFKGEFCTILRRFNQFRQLHGSLSGEEIPPLPSDGLWSLVRADATHLLQHRRDQLELFLQTVDSSEKLRSSSAILQFLQQTSRDEGSGYVSLAYCHSPEIRLRSITKTTARRRRTKKVTCELNQLYQVV